MKRKSFLFNFAALMSVLNLVSCATTQNLNITYIIDESEPVKDKSFPAEEKVCETNKITSVEDKRETVIDWMDKKNFIHLTASKKIEVYGVLAEVNKNPYKENKTFRKGLFFTNFKRKYIWNGYVEYKGNLYNSALNIQLKRKKDRNTYEVTSANCGNISMKVYEKFGDNAVQTPCKLFTSTNGVHNFDIFSTQDKNWKAFGEAANDEKNVIKFMPKISVRDMVNLDGQKFQVLENEKVVAEIYGGKYFIYLNEDDERFDILVQTLGMVQTYIFALNKLEV